MVSHSPSMNEELDSRLDELFDDNKPASALKKTEKKTNPLESLQATVLEMEWEIKDSNIDQYLAELQQVGSRFKGEKALCIYVKILDTMGRYLKAKKANAHPETVSFLKVIYDDFQVAVTLPDDERNRSAAKQVNAFKKFKTSISEHVAARKTHDSGRPQSGALTDEVKGYIRKVVREEIMRLVKQK